MDSVSALCDAIHSSLRVGINKKCQFTVELRTDIFKYLFKDKGSKYNYGTGRLYTNTDFNETYFPTDWYKVHDRLGDSCEVEFPIRMFSHVKWSPTVYSCTSSSTVTPKNKYYREVCTVWLIKKRC